MRRRRPPCLCPWSTSVVPMEDYSNCHAATSIDCKQSKEADCRGVRLPTKVEGVIPFRIQTYNNPCLIHGK